jgi:hypothetical protein
MVKGSHLASSSPHTAVMTGEHMQDLDRNVSKHVAGAEKELEKAFSAVVAIEETHASIIATAKAELEANKIALASVKRVLERRGPVQWSHSIFLRP